MKQSKHEKRREQHTAAIPNDLETAYLLRISDMAWASI